MWLRHDNFNRIVNRLWNEDNGGDRSVMKKLEKTREGLKKSNIKEFGRVNVRIKNLRSRLQWLNSQYRSLDVIEEETMICNSLDEWMLREELMWKQRSRVDWMKERDMNTKVLSRKGKF
ncbi:hypothetical protein QQ045_033309 [Rhodiola kirilowii]